MIRPTVTLIVVSLLAWLMVRVEAGIWGSGSLSVTFMLGFVLLAAYVVGLLGEFLRLPRITGYILTGVLFGPYLLDFLGFEVLESLEVFNDMAMAFIGLAAGSELRMAMLKARARSVILLILFTTVIVIVGVTGIAFAAQGVMPFAEGRTTIQILAMCALVGIVSAARSPSSAIAVISETRAKGPFSETILGVAMSMDLLILPLFSVTAALAVLAFHPARSLDVRFILVLCIEIAGSIVVGGLLGGALARYIRARGPQLGLVILGLCFVVYRSSQAFEHHLHQVHDVVIHLEPLLICAAAGFTVQNFSKQGERLLEAQESVGLPVYVIFFTMAGAVLNMSALAAGWAVAFLLVGGRLSMIFLGCRVATTLAKDPPAFRNWCWLGFVTQAGLSIALAGQLATAFGAWGKQLGSLLVAAIAVNQIIGPVAFKFALDRVGETRRSRPGLRPEPVEAEPPS